MESKPPSPSLWDATASTGGLECCRQWLNTPHKDRMAKVGVGIDCLYFVREVLVASGMLPTWVFPYYRPVWGVGREFNVMERVFTKCCHARKLANGDFYGSGEDWADGDVLVFAVGRQSNHVGIYMDGQVWHSAAGAGVRNVDLDEPIAASMQCVLRMTAPGFQFRPEELTRADFAT